MTSVGVAAAFRRNATYLGTLVLVACLFAAGSLLSRGPMPQTTAWSVPADYFAGTLTNMDALSAPGSLLLESIPGSWGVLYPQTIAPMGVATDWDGSGIRSVTVVPQGTQYQMWYAGCLNATCAIGYATSPDAIDWWPGRNNPILAANASTWFRSLDHPTVVDDRGTYRMWCAGNGSAGTAIGEADSSDGLLWIPRAAAELSPFPGAWDAAGVGSPTVVLGASGYTLWFSGRDANGTEAIGRATSTDGVHWTQDSTNPVFRPASLWEGGQVQTADVLLSGIGYEMYYIAGGSNGLVGHATSPDGRTWTRDAANPLFPRPDPSLSAGKPVLDASVIHGQTRSLMWYTHPEWSYGGVVGIAFSPGFAPSGSFASKVLDMGTEAGSWDSVTWMVDDPRSGVTVEFAAGDTPSPDASWQCCAKPGDNGLLTIGWSGHRYAQVRINVSGYGYDSSPLIWNLAVAFTEPAFYRTATGLAAIVGLLALGGGGMAAAVHVSGHRRRKERAPPPPPPPT